jgi:hypothetical protein
LYPLSEFDGKVKVTDWAKLPSFGSGETSAEEIKWVDPAKFWDLDQTPPQPGEEALYAQARALLEAAQKDPGIKAAIVDEAAQADAQLVTPLFNFNTFGKALQAHWNTISNGAEFGTDYFTRTAVAKSNIFVNKPNETKYFYADADASGQRLNGAQRYTVTFPKGQLPPVKGFWSLTLYNAHHFFSPNEQKRYSLGTKNKKLKYNDDGVADALCAELDARRRQGRQLAARAGQRRFFALRAGLLAGASCAGWYMDTTASCAGHTVVDVDAKNFPRHREREPDS